MSIDDTDSHDPVIAEQFRALDEIAAPDTAWSSIAPSSGLVELPPERPYRRHLMAAAAGLVVLAGAGVVYGAWVSVQGPEVTVSASDASANQPPSASSTTVPPAVARPTASISTTSTTSTTAPAVTETSTTTPTTTRRPTTQSSTTQPSTTQPSTTAPSTTSPSSTSSSAPSTTSTTVFEPGEVQAFTGVATEVFTDCASRLVLNEDGEVEERGPVTCDGGSYIVVGTTRVQTSAGNVAPGFPYYDKHPRDLLPGTEVAVRSVAGENGALSLSCEQCSVSVAGES